jgi:hypothetical protein
VAKETCDRLRSAYNKTLIFKNKPTIAEDVVMDFAFLTLKEVGVATPTGKNYNDRYKFFASLEFPEAKMVSFEIVEFLLNFIVLDKPKKSTLPLFSEIFSKKGFDADEIKICFKFVNKVVKAKTSKERAILKKVVTYSFLFVVLLL